MSEMYRIAMLWVEGDLSYLEQLCIQSFLDAGHPVSLFHYGVVGNVPKGVRLVHGDTILQIDNFIQHERTGSLALFSDVFRYHLLARSEGLIWADTDAYCLRPFRSETGHYFGWESDLNINGGVLGLPADSPALANLLKMTTDEFGIPPWYSPQTQQKLQERSQSGNPTHVSELPWGVWGPHAVTYHLHQTAEAKYAFERHVLYPVKFEFRRRMCKAKHRSAVDQMLHADTTSIHFYGRRMRAFLAAQPDGLPEKGSLIDHLLDKHQINPVAAPVSDKFKRQASNAEGETVGEN